MGPPSLTDLEAFAAVARLRSFRRAALERGVSPSLLSQTVSRLEEQVGVVLLKRTTRSVLASDAGEELLRQLEPALLQIHDAVDRINRHRESPVGSLRINAPAPVAQFLLAPLAAAFLKECPGVSLTISADAAKTDIVKAGFDAGVRFEGDLAQDVVAVRIGSAQRYCVVASETYFKNRGRPTHPDELLNHECIRRTFPGGTVFEWVFQRKGITKRVQPKGSLTVNDSQIAVNAAVAGAGIAYIHENYTKRELVSGELVQALQEWSPGLGPPFLYYPRQRYLPASLRAFIDFAKKHGARGQP
jgi:DNA-binding transcriptional LysR family regulator